MHTRKMLGLRGQTALGLSLLVLAIAAPWPAGSARAADGAVVKAAQINDLASVRELIKAGADVNAPSRDGSTALLWAAYHSHPEMIKALLAAGAVVDAANKYGVTALLQASRTGDAVAVKALLEGRADVQLAHPEGETPLMAASRAGSVDAVRLLLARGANPNARESFQQQTALMWAAAEGHTAVIDALLTAGAEPNLQAHVNALTVRKNADFPTGGFTALMWAARNGDEASVRRLVKGGADLNLTNGDGATALMLAIVNDRFDFAAMLVELGANADSGALYRAVEMRDATTDWFARDGSRLRANHPNERTALDLIALLLDAGADANEPFVGQMHNSSMCCDTSANASPFYRAAVAADVEALKLLIAHGANLEWTPTKAEPGGPGVNEHVGRTAIMAAMTGGRGVPISAGPGFNRAGPPPFRESSDREPAAAVQLLLAAGANANAVAPDGDSALHRAVDARNLDILRALTEAGADLDYKNPDGLTALDWAERIKPQDPNANVFGPRVIPGASPEAMAALLREAAQKTSTAREATAQN